MFANSNRDPKKQARPFRPEEFMFSRGAKEALRPKVQTWQEQLKVVEAINKALGGKDLRKKASK